MELIALLALILVVLYQADKIKELKDGIDIRITSLERVLKENQNSQDKAILYLGKQISNIEQSRRK